jgi:hypothetical protein
LSITTKKVLQDNFYRVQIPTGIKNRSLMYLKLDTPNL